MSKQLSVLLSCALLSGCETTPPGRDAAFEVPDAPGADIGRALPDSGGEAADGGGRTDSGSPTDAGPPRPDARVAEDCAAPGDEDGDRQADCDDVDCWSGCAANHVARRHPGLAECGIPIVHTATDSRTACLAYTGAPDDAPTRCDDIFSLTATARFFCDDAGVATAFWLDEALSVPPTESRSTPPASREITRWGYETVRDVVRMSQTSGSGPRSADLQLQSGAPDVRLITVYTIEPSDVSFVRMLGLQQTTEVVSGDPPRIVSSSRALFRTGATAITMP